MKRPARDKVPLKCSVKNAMPNFSCRICRIYTIYPQKIIIIIKAEKDPNFSTTPYPKRQDKIKRTEPSSQIPLRNPRDELHTPGANRPDAPSIYKKTRRSSESKSKKKVEDRKKNEDSAKTHSDDWRFIEELRSKRPAGEPEGEASGVRPHRGEPTKPQDL